MTYLALHMTHYKAGQCSAILAEADHIGDRDNVDKKLTSQNYDAITGTKPQDYKSARNKLQNIATNYGMNWEKDNGKIVIKKADGKRVRQDCNVMTGVVITLDRDTCDKWGKDKVKSYFGACARYLADKMPCCQAVVHCDEPAAGVHLHFYGSSIVDGNYNAKKMWRRGDLVKLHTDMTKYLQNKGFDVQRGESGKNYNKSVADLKRDDTRVMKAVNQLTAQIKIDEPSTMAKMMGAEPKYIMPLDAGKSLLRALSRVRDKIDTRDEINRLERDLEGVRAELYMTRSTLTMIEDYDADIIAKAEKAREYRQVMAKEAELAKARQAMQAELDAEYAKKMLAEIKNEAFLERKSGGNTNIRNKGKSPKNSVKIKGNEGR